MSHIKKFTMLTVALIMLFSSACATEDIYIDEVEDETPLRIYLFSYDFTLERNIENYNRMVAEDGREIEITRFESGSMENNKDMYNKILNEMSLGGGPDVIEINLTTHRFLDINKMSKANAFADMDILIENSDSFDFNDYNKMVLDAGIINGTRVLIPTSYSIGYIIGVEETFEYHNLEIPKELTVDTYLDLIEQYYQNTKYPAVIMNSHMFLLSKFIKVGEPIQKSEQLERIFETLKTDYNRYNDLSNERRLSGNEFMKSNILFFSLDSTYFSNYRSLARFYNLIENQNESHMILFNPPNNANSSLNAYSDTGFVININSKHKNEAFAFIEYMLSECMQSSSYAYALPVNKNSYDDEVKSFLDGFFDSDYTDLGVEDADTPIELKKDFIEYVESAKSCEYIGCFEYVYINLIYESIKDYYNDKLTYDELIDELNNKLTIYYTE